MHMHISASVCGLDLWPLERKYLLDRLLYTNPLVQLLLDLEGASYTQKGEGPPDRQALHKTLIVFSSVGN